MEVLFVSVEDYILVRGVSLVYIVKMNFVRMVEYVLIVWMVLFVSVIWVLGEKGVRVILMSVLEIFVCMGFFVRICMVFIIVIVVMSIGDVIVRMLCLISMCLCCGILGWWKELELLCLL